MLRYLRFAVAAMFAALAIGFVALWVRSHYVCDWVSRQSSGTQILVVSQCGGFLVRLIVSDSSPAIDLTEWQFISSAATGPISKTAGYCDFQAVIETDFKCLLLPHS